MRGAGDRKGVRGGGGGMGVVNIQEERETRS